MAVEIPSVLFTTITTDSRHTIGTITLNDPKALNALSSDMCKLMAHQLTKWQNDPNIVAILLQGSGDKAFCAGGNIRKLYDSMVDFSTQSLTSPPLQQPNPYAIEFLTHEYNLYRQMHFYPKPIILWGNGIIMGGGMGLMAMCSHRVVTETTRFAMPEITIGLYPDATGSWFLARMPANIGLFLGLTGANCNANDAIFTSLAEYAVASDEYEKVVQALVTADWQQNTNLHDIASHALSQIHHTEQLAESNIINHFAKIQALVNAGSIYDIDTLLQSENWANGDKWLTKAVDTYRQGCPVTACLAFEAFYRAKKLSLEQVLYMEMNISVHCSSPSHDHYTDFREGVRALLIDKDKSPKWSRTLAECDKAYIDSHFASAFPNHNHPFESWLGDGSMAVKVVKNLTY